MHEKNGIELTDGAKKTLLIALGIGAGFFMLIGVAVADFSSESSSPVTATAPPEIVQDQSRTEPVGFGEDVVEDPNLPAGQTAVRREGAMGERAVTFAVTTRDGKEVARALKRNDITRAPINRVVARGTYIAPPPRAPKTLPFNGDLDCRDVSWEEAQDWVAQGDPHGFDGDGDGEGCEGNR